jgi:hypothetical protein
MAKQIAKLLKTEMDLQGLAQILKSRGRGNDKILAHITPKEAALLKKRGGSGTTNPDTGLPEFDDSGLSYAEGESMVNPVGYDYSKQPSAADFGPFGIPAETQAPSAPAPIDTTAVAPVPAGAAAGGAEYSPFQFTSPAQVADIQKFYGQNPELGAPPPPEPPSFLDKAKNFLTTPNKAGDTPLEKLGIAGIGAIPGIMAARKAQQQGDEAKAAKQALASPYQDKGKALQEAALRGELSPAGQQALEAARAQMAQNESSRGGVGSQQNAVALQKLQESLLANQYQLGMQVSQIGDQIAIGAIDTGLKADQYVNSLTQGYFNQLFAYVGGMPSQPTYRMIPNG